MIRDSIIHLFATAMALACSGMVFAAPAPFLSHHQTVQSGETVTFTAHLTATSATPAAASQLFSPLFVLEANDRLRRVETLALVDGGIGVDLAKLATLVAADKPVHFTGTYVHTSVDALKVTKLVVDDVSIAVPTAAEAKRITALASHDLLRYIRSLNPQMADGPEAVVDGAEVVSNDHVIVTVHFVSGWTHQPINGMTARALVVISGDDEVRVLDGRLQ